MAKVPRDANPREVIKALRRLGFRVETVTGSHYKLVHESDPSRIAIVPFHKALRTGLLASILRQARVGLDEFLRVFTIL
ncbi:MAG: type II toxin-antitoxin system HicA family toxin [Candidatus Thermoplasmatota archaeon]